MQQQQQAAIRPQRPPQPVGSQIQMTNLPIHAASSQQSINGQHVWWTESVSQASRKRMDRQVSVKQALVRGRALKQCCIARIMGLEESVQRVEVIMQSIQELENSVHAPRLSLGASLNFESFNVADGNQQRLLGELQAAVYSRDQMAQRYHELDQQLSLMIEERNTLQVEVKKLQERLDKFENPEEAGTWKKLEDEMFKLETSQDNYRLIIELLEKEISELKTK